MNPEQESAEPADSSSSGDVGAQRLRVALSGGGLRAAVFDLGLLVYLMDAGLNPRVEQISSVSGGSITNAFVAQRCNFQKVSSQEFNRIATDLLNMIVRRGLLRQPLIIGYLALVVAAAGFTVSVWLTQFPVHLNGWTCLFLAVGTGLLLTLRGRVLDLQLERTLSQDGVLTPPRRLRDVTSTVEHIFCSTDLRTGMPFYFSTAGGGYVYSPALGFSLCAARLGRVVRASAAFPGGVPPLRYKSPRSFALTRAEDSTQLRITRNASLGHYESKIFMLADGGIWNNLATQPFLEDHLWFGFEIDISHQCSKRSQPPGLLIVSNASSSVLASSSKDFNVPLLGELFSFKRSLKIATENTVLPRIEAIRSRPDTAVVSIVDSYGRALSKLDEHDVITRLPPGCDALRLWKEYNSDPDSFQDTLPWCLYQDITYGDKARNNADIKTSLGRIPRWRTIMLLKQAYENAQSELAVMLGLPIPESSTDIEKLIPYKGLDWWHDVRRDRAARLLSKREYQTLEPATVSDEIQDPRSRWFKFCFGLWQFWNWLTKEEPADIPHSLRQAKRWYRREHRDDQRP